MTLKYYDSLVLCKTQKYIKYINILIYIWISIFYRLQHMQRRVSGYVRDQPQNLLWKRKEILTFIPQSSMMKDNMGNI